MAFTATMPPAYQRLLTFYNGNPYELSLNPGGMDDDGHYHNFIPCCQDVAAMGAFAATMALVASQYANGSNGWASEGAAVARLSGTQFTVAGNKVAIYQTNRALQVTQTSSGFGYVAAATYASGTNLTTVTVVGISLDAGFTGVALGQAIENAPCVPNLATTLFVTSNFVTP